MDGLTEPEEETIRVADSIVWGVERNYVRRRMRKRFLFSNTSLSNQISTYGIRAAALGMASVYWIVLGGPIFAAGIVVELLCGSNDPSIKWIVVYISCVFFFVSIVRMVQSVTSQIKFSRFRSKTKD